MDASSLTRPVSRPFASSYGADLVERNGRFTGALSGPIPIGQTKVDLLAASVAASAGMTTGYGDHPTDVPFLEACDRGVHASCPARRTPLCRAPTIGPS